MLFLFIQPYFKAKIDVFGARPSWLVYKNLSNWPSLKIIRGSTALRLSVMVVCTREEWPSHNALLPMRYFAQLVMWVVSDKRHLSYQKSSKSHILGRFCHQQPTWPPTYHWKQCMVVEKPHYLFWACTLRPTHIQVNCVKLHNYTVCYLHDYKTSLWPT